MKDFVSIEKGARLVGMCCRRVEDCKKSFTSKKFTFCGTKGEKFSEGGVAVDGFTTPCVLAVL